MVCIFGVARRPSVHATRARRYCRRAGGLSNHSAGTEVSRVKLTTMAEDLITVGRYFWLHEALVASGLLEGAGIPSCLYDANVVRLDWLYVNAIQGIRIQVPIARAEEA